MRIGLIIVFVSAAVAESALAQQPAASPAAPPRPAGAAEAPAGGPQLDQVLKHVDDLMWHLKLSDIADVDSVAYTGMPPAKASNPNAPGAKNPIILHAYTFIPKNLDRSKKQPLLVYVHQGVHANFGTEPTHVIRELVQQGYSIVATDYRGSSGYGRGFYEQIDYGGREVDDVYQGLQWMLGNYDFFDAKRVGIIGWTMAG